VPHRGRGPEKRDQTLRISKKHKVGEEEESQKKATDRDKATGSSLRLLTAATGNLPDTIASELKRDKEGKVVRKK